MKEYTLQEAESLLPQTRATLRRLCEKGEITGRLITKGTRQVWKIPESEIERLLARVAAKTSGMSYEAAYKEWKADMASGALTGRCLNPDTITSYCFGMANYWRFSKLDKTLDNISPEGLRLALSEGSKKRDEKHDDNRDYFASREQVYKAVKSFYKFLVYKGFKSETEAAKLVKFCPKASGDPSRTVLTLQQLEILIEANMAWTVGRSKHDIYMVDMMIKLMAYAGFRQVEVRRLRLGNIDMAGSTITLTPDVTKNKKQRVVPIEPVLAEAIHEWMKRRPADANNDYFLVQAHHRPLTKEVVARRIRNLVEHINTSEQYNQTLRIKPHGLRATGAKRWESIGLVWSEIKMLLGHQDIKTTQRYVYADVSTAFEKLTKYRPTTITESTPEAPALPEIDYS